MAAKKSFKREPVKTHECCEVLKKENTALKSELKVIKEQYTQLIQETSQENFSERRVNLLKSHVLQLERQVMILSDAIQGQSKLLDDLQHYGESLASKLKDGDSSLAADVLPLKKLNNRLKQVPCSREGYSLPILYTGRFYKTLTLLDSLANKDHYKLREMSWLESQLSILYEMLQSLKTTLSVYPNNGHLNASTLKGLDPFYDILLHTNGEIDATMKQLSLVTQELLTLTLTIPGQIPTYKVQREKGGINNDKLREEITRVKPRGRELLETILRTLDSIDRRQEQQLSVQDKEMSKLRELLEGNVMYLEKVFVSIDSNYKEFLASVCERINSPLKDLTANFYHLQRQHGKEILSLLESPLYRLLNVVDEMKNLFDEKQDINESLSAQKLLTRIYKQSRDGKTEEKT